CLRATLADAARDDREGAPEDDLGQAEADEEDVATERDCRYGDRPEMTDPVEVRRQEQGDGRLRERDRPGELEDPARVAGYGRRTHVGCCGRRDRHTGLLSCPSQSSDRSPRRSKTPGPAR